MLKVDLHTHSIASPDGGIRPSQYRQLLASQQLNYIAITDHDRIDLALQLHQELGDQIIVGQEITTLEGEVIGLFLTDLIAPGQAAADTARAIKSQGGLVYIPHPLETVRKGLTGQTLIQIAPWIDIVETHNGRAVFQNRSAQATAWAQQHGKVMAASSDAHGLKGLGRTYSLVNQPLNRDNCLANLAAGQLVMARPPLKTLLYPKLNRFRRQIRRGKS